MGDLLRDLFLGEVDVWVLGLFAVCKYVCSLQLWESKKKCMYCVSLAFRFTFVLWGDGGWTGLMFPLEREHFWCVCYLRGHRMFLQWYGMDGQSNAISQERPIRRWDGA